MRRALALAAVLLLAAACNEQDAGPVTGGEETLDVAESPATLPNASCEDQEGGTPDTFPDFIRAEAEHADGVDRVTFTFRQRQPDATEPPDWYVSYVDELLTDGKGAPVDVEGSTFVAVSFMAVGVDLSGEEPVEVYTGPREIAAGLPVVRELEQTGDFEGVVSWGIGLARESCVQVTATADELVLEFPSP